ncbi:hypothetical protein LR48_Vigan05g117400 [Vigna angularis]|uniref:Uncharacterized protein n=1 Tax=Phaseolus angularis TaxID=3914 RepID=A0A0L9ULY2_PHAAN|nr:hypothetical protein LR48_Vigan05g117400 [Vigna angularis]
MTKITRHQVYHLPRILIEKLALCHMGLRKDEKGWSFKYEHVPKVEEVKPIGVDKSKYYFKPQSEFEKFVVDLLKKQDDKLSKLQKSLSGLHRKLDYALRINAFGGTSEDDTEGEENKTDEEFIEISDSE